MVKYDEKTLQELYGLAKEQGWDQLTQGEKLAVGRWCRTNGMPRPGIEPKKPSAGSGPAAQTTGERVEASPAGKADRDLALIKQVRFVRDWPDDIDPGRPVTQWDGPAAALRMNPRGVALIRGNLPRRRAVEIRRKVRDGSIPAFTPKGSYRCEIAPDHDHPGRWNVYASWQGKTK